MRAIVGVVGLILLAYASAARAADGVLEINDACAVATGCFPDDGPGYPVTITQPGSYVLTGGLRVSNTITTAVDATAASRVSLDLNGHSVTGPVSCPGDFFPACTGSGSGVGVDLGRDSSVRNGMIQGLGGFCVRAARGSLIEDLQLSNCAAGGILVAERSIVRGNRVYANGGHGVVASSTNAFRDGSLVVDNVIIGNLGLGIAMAEPDDLSDVNFGAIGGNLLKGNNEHTGQQKLAGTEISANVCNDTGTNCPEKGCAFGVTEQKIGFAMSGCSGSVTWPNRATLCDEGWHVCSAAEWVERHFSTAPNTNYWTDDGLRFTGSSGSCFVHETLGNPCPADRPMRVCAAAADSLGNTCAWVGCGYHTTTPNHFFGGCAVNPTAGTLWCL